MEQLHQSIIDAVREAGAIVRSADEDKGVKEKSGHQDLVTRYDGAVQRFVRRGGIRRRVFAPQHDMLALECIPDCRSGKYPVQYILHRFVVRLNRYEKVELFVIIDKQIIGLPFDVVKNLLDGDLLSVECHLCLLGMCHTRRQQKNRTGEQEFRQASANFMLWNAETYVFIHTFAE